MLSCVAAASAFPSKSIPRDASRIENIHAERIKRSAAASTSCVSHSRSRRELLSLSSLCTSSSLLLFLSRPPPASASIPSKRQIPLQPPPPRDKLSSVSIVQDAAEVARLVSLATRQGLEDGDWAAARESFARAASFTERGVAAAELARVPAALALAELGRPEEALLELEDALAEGTPALRGRAELHAALAVLRYSLGRRGAEGELSAATLWEPRWGDEKWVRERAAKEKGWPPTMVERLERFLELD